MSRFVHHDWFLSHHQRARRSVAKLRSTTGPSPYSRRLRLEPLEDRRLLAIVTVDTLDDTVNFGDGVTSLREAIFATNLVGGADTIEFAPSLTNSGPATITLTQGELTITDDLEINGTILLQLNGITFPLITIDASGNDTTPDLNNGDGSRVFNINDGISGNLLDVSVSGLTLTGGDASGAGGAIFTRENLSVAHSIITGNSTNSPQVQGGGGIYSGAGFTSLLPSSLTLIDCVIADNAAGRSEGGGIRKRSGSLVVEGGTFSGNTALLGGGVSAADERVEVQISGSTFLGNTAMGGTFGGGAVFISNGTLTLGDSKLSGNSAPRGGGLYLEPNAQATLDGCIIEGNFAGVSGGGVFGRNLTVTDSMINANSTTGNGGGIAKLGAGSVTLTNSTISGNSATGNGGGIFSSFGGNVTVAGSTVSYNAAGLSGGGIIGNNLAIHDSTIIRNSAGLDGGGIRAASPTALNHTIVAGNTRGAAEANDVNGSVTFAFSLLGVDTGATITDNGGNLIGTAAAPIDPLLGPLADNGGPTLPDGSNILTHALLAGSPAINRGDLTAVAGVGGVSEFDQRETPFGRVFNGRIDIGAFEYQAASDLNLVVDTLVDESDGNFARGDLSLREALLLANTYPSVDTIQFAAALTAGGSAKILLTLGELAITDNTTIEGPGANLLTIQAFDPTPGAKNGDGSRILNIDDGNAATMIDVSISGLTLTGGDIGNSGSGGGIRNLERLRVTDSAITGNATSDPPFQSYPAGGGGIHNGGHLTVVRSTLTDNSTPREGGAIRSTGTGSVVVVTDSTISGNTAGRNGLGSGEGGGIAVVFGGSLTVTGSTISDNSSDYRGGGIWLRNDATLTVTGTTISGNSTQRGGGGIASYRGNVTVIGSTISGNSTSQVSWGGGGISSYQGSVTVTDSTISDNSAVPIYSGITGGGGIFSNGATLTVTRSTIRGNSAQQGGGIFHGGGSATIIGSTISGNSAVVTDHPSGPLGGYGGGLFTSNGSMTVTGSTISRNSGKFGGGISSGDRFTTNSTLTVADSTIDSNTVVDGHGGGIFHRAPSGALTIIGSTISGNTTSEHGGGLYLSTYNTLGTFTIRHSSIAANTAYGQFGGGGTFVQSGTLVLDHTIVATNVTLTGFGRDLSGLLSASIDARYSLIGDKSGSGLADAPVGSPDAKGNLIGVFPELTPLANNGGLTKTHALAASSPARNAGNPSAVGGVGTVPGFDQRGAPYVRVFGGRIDIGAYERQTVQIPSLVVDTLVDETDGDYSLGDLSLREAIGLANGSVDSLQTITFAPALTSGGAATIHLTRGELGIGDSLTIVGPGANLLTIDASASDPTPNQNNFDGSRVFRVDDGNFESDKPMSIFGLTLTGGDANIYGGAIFSTESLTIVDSTVKNNSASFSGAIDSRGNVTTITGSTIRDNVGGGISSYSANLHVTDSTITGNSGRGIGGGGTVTVTRSTVSGNSAGQGGGIYATGILTVSASTISGNSAQFGGGIMSRGPITLTDSTVSGNRATYGYGGGILSLGYGQTTITNSTISGNFANTLGGGIHFRSQLTLSHSTITGNRANTNGGGISNSGYGSVQLGHTIVAGNTRGATTRSDIFGSANLAFSLLGVNTGATIGDIGGNLIGTSSAPINALLGPLADNGGPTMPDGSKMLTRALLPGSPAINAGDPSAVPGVGGVPQFDQRGGPWSRVSGGRIDIGAFESQILPPAAFGDYNGDRVVGTADYTVWRNTLGSTSDLRADGNADGVVNSLDYAIWKTHFGETLPLPVAGSGAAAISFSQPAAEVGESFGPEPDASIAAPQMAKAEVASVAGFALLESRSEKRDSSSRRSEPAKFFGVAKSVSDNLLLTLAIDRIGNSLEQESSEFDDRRNVGPQVDDYDSQCLTDNPLAVALAEWQ